MDIQIILATQSDVPEILNCIRGLAEYEHFEHIMTATEDSLRETLFGAEPAAKVLLALSESKCVGFAVFFPTFCSVLGQRGLFMDHLFVKPEWRGKGVGDALLAHLAKVAVERNCAARLEWNVLDWNTRAIDFYKSEGATVLDGWMKCRMTEADIHALAARI